MKTKLMIYCFILTTIGLNIQAADGFLEYEEESSYSSDVSLDYSTDAENSDNDSFHFPSYSEDDYNAEEGQYLESKGYAGLKKKKIRKMHEEMHKAAEKGMPALFVNNCAVYPEIDLLSDQYADFIPLSDFLKYKKDAQNVVATLEYNRKGRVTKGKGVAILGSPNFFQAYFRENDLQRLHGIRFIPLGSANDLDDSNSLLHKTLEYVGHFGPTTNVQKRELAFHIGQKFFKEKKMIAPASIWYGRAMEDGSVVASRYLEKMFNFFKDLTDFRGLLGFGELSPTKLRNDISAANHRDSKRGNLYAIRDIARYVHETESLIFEINGPPRYRMGESIEKAIKGYARAFGEKNHKNSLCDIIRCFNFLQINKTDSTDSLVAFLQELERMIIPKCADEEVQNRLADLSRVIDDKFYGNNRGFSCLEYQNLASMQHILTSNTKLRLALLKKEVDKCRSSKGESVINECNYFIDAAKAGNPLAMLKLNRLYVQQEGNRSYDALVWKKNFLKFKSDILSDSKLKYALAYLGYLDPLGSDLLKELCSVLHIDTHSIIKEQGKCRYSSTRDKANGPLWFPSTVTLLVSDDYKRKRENDLVVYEEEHDIPSKKMREKEEESE